MFTFEKLVCRKWKTIYGLTIKGQKILFSRRTKEEAQAALSEMRAEAPRCSFRMLHWSGN